MKGLKGRPLSLTLLYLERDDHVTGLIRLLSGGLRVLPRLGMRHLLAPDGRTDGVLCGGRPADPHLTTARPTTERLLKRCQGVTLTIIRDGRRRRCIISRPFPGRSRRMLALSNFPVDISTRLCPDSHKPP